MISLSRFRENLFPLFKLMARTGMTMDVVHDGKVYEVMLTETDRKPKRNIRRRKSRGVGAIETEHCDECGYLKVMSVCLNTACDS